MKKIFILLLSFLMLCPLFSCTDNNTDGDVSTSDPDVTTTEASTSDENAKEDEKPTVPQKNGNLTLMLDGEKLFSVVRPDVASDDVVAAAVSVNTAIKELTGSLLTIKTDFLKKGETPDENALEILIGNTNRKESLELTEQLDKNQFAIKTTDSKIVIVATDSSFLTLGVEYFIENYLTGNSIESSDGKLVLNKKIEYFSEPVFHAYEQLFESSKTLSSTCTKLLSASAPSSTIKIPQGGYCDEEFFYQLFIYKDTASDEANNIARIVKVSLATKKVVKTSGDLDLNHSNDMTYNPKLDRFVVCHNNPNRTRISLIDPETLEVTDVLTIPCKIYCISYNEEHDMYVVGLSGGQTFRFLDSDFKFVDDNIYQPTSTTKGFTTQGVASDSKYIYFVLYNSNVITVYDWDGNFVTEIALDMGKVEPENITIVGNTIYVATTGSGVTLWTVTPKAE